MEELKEYVQLRLPIEVVVEGKPEHVIGLSVEVQSGLTVELRTIGWDEVEERWGLDQSDFVEAKFYAESMSKPEEDYSE
jgi:hypothetical protein